MSRNEPAFPSVKRYIGQDTFEVLGDGGLTKRELFAAMALQGIVSRPDLSNDCEQLIKRYGHKTLGEAVADQAVAAADALIKELERTDVP